jgi:hypothetical protein
MNAIITNEKNDFEFFKVQNCLYSKKFKSMSNNAKQLYLMLYQRNNMSIKNGWQDKNGSTFIFFTRKEVEELLNISHTTAVNAFKELKKFTLIN